MLCTFGPEAVRNAILGARASCPRRLIRDALAPSFQMCFRMERKQLALDAEIRGLLEVRGQDALAPDIGGSRRDCAKIASGRRAFVSGIAKLGVLPGPAATRKEKIPGPMTAVQDNLERTTLDRCDTSSDSVSDTQNNHPGRLESRGIL